MKRYRFHLLLISFLLFGLAGACTSAGSGQETGETGIVYRSPT